MSLRSQMIRLAASLPQGEEKTALLEILATEKEAGVADNLMFLSEEIKPLTQANNHNEAHMVLAKALNARREIKVMEMVMSMSKLYGHTPQPMMDMRYHYVYKPLLKQAKRMMDADAFEELRMSF